MATHFSTLAWKIPGTEEPGRLQSMGSQRAELDLVTKHAFNKECKRYFHSYVHYSVMVLLVTSFFPLCVYNFNLVILQIL